VAFDEGDLIVIVLTTARRLYSRYTACLLVVGLTVSTLRSDAAKH
jgi:hypothetical protein